MNLSLVKVNLPADSNIIIGQAHFIKTVDDLYEICATSQPGLEFGIAFCEASQERLIRWDGNSEELIDTAVENARAIGAGHVFVILIRKGYPINLLNAIKDCQEVCRVFCATANPLEVILAESNQGRGVAGVVDGESPAGVEDEGHRKARRELLRRIGYKR